METKALFFSLYLGQTVRLEYDEVSYINTLTPEYLLMGVNENEINLQSDTGKSLWYNTEKQLQSDKLKSMSLLLRTVDQLTHEEALTVYNIFHLKDGKQDHADLDDILRIGAGLARSTWTLCNPLDTLIMQSYLRSIGILLPFTYLTNNKPSTLTPDELVAKGWIKVK